MRIKDGMREQCLPQARRALLPVVVVSVPLCLNLPRVPSPQIADAWYSILQLHEDRPPLSAACLHTIHLYVGWIDIGLIATPRSVIRV